MLKTCGKGCKLYIPQQKICQLMKIAPIKPTDYCSHYKKELYTCENCGQSMLTPIIEVTEDRTHIYCPNCITRI